jgi:hypothetical protein
MKEIKITKKQLEEQYNKSLDEYLDICDWVTYVDGKTVCGLVYGILTTNNIEKPLPVEEFHELYLIKYNKKLYNKIDTPSLETNEVLDVVYDLLCELLAT